MKKLKLIRILEYYDVPQLFIADDASGIHYLCLLYNIEDDGELKTIAVSVSPSRLNEFIKGHIDLLSVFSNPETGYSLYDIKMKEDALYAHRFSNRLSQSMLPDEGYYFNESSNENDTNIYSELTFKSADI